MIEIKNVSRTFGSEKVLNNIDFCIYGGMNFIIGASGSGKTTLLKIISAMDLDFSGDVFYKGKSIKSLSYKEKYEQYANTFGFISQSFNLIDNLTVLENIILPQHLKNNINYNEVLQIAKNLGINKLLNMQVKKLSGGQKQRVAIARELIKRPQVLIADEPTASLDPKSAKAIIEILKKIAKTTTVIVVTHDTSLIDEKSSVFELDKGTLVSKTEFKYKETVVSNQENFPKFSTTSAYRVSTVNIKRYIGRFITLTLSILVTTCCLLVNFTDIIGGKRQNAIDELISSYGNSILELTLTPTIMQASQMGSENMEPQNKVEQSIDGLYEKYINDDRVDHVRYTPGITDVKVSLNGKSFTPKPSYSLPSFDKLLSGRMPNGNGKEVIVTDIVAKMLGHTNESILNKEININAGMFVNEGYKSILKPFSIKAIVVGVTSTNGTMEHEGQVYEFEFEDALFFNVSAIKDIKSQVGTNMDGAAFTLRAKTPKDLISVKNELMKNGIVPLGDFEKIEDILKIDNISGEQSKTSYLLIGILALVTTLAVTIVTAFLRRNEFAVYKINGYTNFKLAKIITCEFANIGAISSLLAIGLCTILIFSGNSFSLSEIGIAIALIVIVTIVCIINTCIIASKTDETKFLRKGDRV